MHGGGGGADCFPPYVHPYHHHNMFHQHAHLAAAAAAAAVVQQYSYDDRSPQTASFNNQGTGYDEQQGGYSQLGPSYDGGDLAATAAAPASTSSASMISSNGGGNQLRTLPEMLPNFGVQQQQHSPYNNLSIKPAAASASSPMMSNRHSPPQQQLGTVNLTPPPTVTQHHRSQAAVAAATTASSSSINMFRDKLGLNSPVTPPTPPNATTAQQVSPQQHRPPSSPKFRCSSSSQNEASSTLSSRESTPLSSMQRMDDGLDGSKLVVAPNIDISQFDISQVKIEMQVKLEGDSGVKMEVGESHQDMKTPLGQAVNDVLPGYGQHIQQPALLQHHHPHHLSHQQQQQQVAMQQQQQELLQQGMFEPLFGSSSADGRAGSAQQQEQHHNSMVMQGGHHSQTTYHQAYYQHQLGHSTYLPGPMNHQYRGAGSLASEGMSQVAPMGLQGNVVAAASIGTVARRHHGSVKIGRRPSHLPKELKRLDKTLPPGWQRKLKQRKHGKQAGRWDVYIYSPCGVKFASRKKLKGFLEKANLNYDSEDFDFTPYGRNIDHGTRRSTQPASSSSSSVTTAVSTSVSGAGRHNSSGSTGSDGTALTGSSPSSLHNYSPPGQQNYMCQVRAAASAMMAGTAAAAAAASSTSYKHQNPDFSTAMATTTSTASSGSFQTDHHSLNNALSLDLPPPGFSSGSALSNRLQPIIPALPYHPGRGHPLRFEQESEFYPVEITNDILGDASTTSSMNGTASGSGCNMYGGSSSSMSNKTGYQPMVQIPSSILAHCGDDDLEATGNGGAVDGTPCGLTNPMVKSETRLGTAFRTLTSSQENPFDDYMYN